MRSKRASINYLHNSSMRGALWPRRRKTSRRWEETPGSGWRWWCCLSASSGGRLLEESGGGLLLFGLPGGLTLLGSLEHLLHKTLIYRNASRRLSGIASRESG